MDRKEFVEWTYSMHLQNLSGREDFTEAFRAGIKAAVEELDDVSTTFKFMLPGESKIRTYEAESWQRVIALQEFRLAYPDARLLELKHTL